MELNPHRRDSDDEEFNAGFNNSKPNSATKKEYSNPEKLVIFYNSPIVTFSMNVISFLVYLGLFAYVVLSGFQINDVFVSGSEYLLLTWTFTLLLEELREVINQKPRPCWMKFRIHIKDAWNVMDMLSLIVFFIGFGLRHYIQYLDVALTLYTIAFMLQCMRLVHIFAVHPLLGPKIIMVGKMLKDTLIFLSILIVFLLAYGVASQALLYPGGTSFTEILVGIIYRPYWMIYGELFLDEINYDPNGGAFTCSDTDASLPRCPRSTPVVPIISAFYMLFANALLLNLLIAMFSHTFQKIQNQSNEIWRRQRCNLVRYYADRPPLVPPFIILYHIYLLLKFVRRYTPFKPPFNESHSDNQFCYTLDLKEWKIMNQWERIYTHEVVHEKQKDDIYDLFTTLNDRMNEITTTLRVESRMRDSSHIKMMERFNQLQKSARASEKIPPKKLDVDEKVWKDTSRWEHSHAYEFDRKQQQPEENQMDRQLTKLSDRMDSITTTLEVERASLNNKLDAIIKIINQPDQRVALSETHDDVQTDIIRAN